MQEIGNAIANYLTSEKHGLRPLQVKALNDVAQDALKGNSCGHVRFPTGGGKGNMIGAQIEALLDADARGDITLGNRKILVLTPRQLLVDDLHERFAESEHFAHLDGDLIGKRHGNLSDAEKKAALEKPVLVTTYPSYLKLLEQGEIASDSYPVVLLDEVHRTRGEQISQAIRNTLPGSYVLGLTATDHYENGKHVGQELFGREDPIHVTGFREAVEEGVLCPVINHVVRTHIDIGIDRSAGNQDYREEDLQKIGNHHARDKMAVELLANHTDPNTGTSFKDQNSVFYCVGVEHARRLAEQLNEKLGEGYAVAVSGETPKKELDAIMRRYADPNDPLKAVANADLLIEGWDAPNAALCFMLRPTKSTILAEQTGGRVMRIDPHNPQKTAHVITFLDDNMPDMVTFGDVIGGYHLGVEQNRQPRELQERKADAEHAAPAWLRDDAILQGMEISMDMRKIMEFVDDTRKEARKDIVQSKPDDNWLSASAMQKAVAATGMATGQKPKLEKLVADLSKKYAAQAEGKGGEPITVEHKGKSFRMGTFMAGGAPHIHFHRDDINLIRQTLGLSNKMPDSGWLGFQDVKSLLTAKYGEAEMKSGKAGEVFSNLQRSALDALATIDPEVGAVPVPAGELTVQAGRFAVPGRSSSKSSVILFYEADMPTLFAAVDVARGQQGGKEEPSWADRVGSKKRDISPESLRDSSRRDNHPTFTR